MTADNFLIEQNDLITVEESATDPFDVVLIEGPRGSQGVPGAKGDTGATGAAGAAASVAVGSVTTGNPGSSAVVTNSGNSTAAVFNFTVPRGDTGPVGPAGTTSWNGLVDKPAVIAAGATQADARNAIGAGTSSLVIGSTDTTAKRGDYTPSGNEITTALGYTPESSAHRNQVNGYAGLDSSGLIPPALLPSFVDDVVEAANVAAFPATGEPSKLYVALDTGKVFRWGGTTYVEVSASPGSTDAVPEGSVNQYFTNARAQGAVSAQLAGKSDVGHTHAQNDVTGLTSALAGKSDVGHSHAQSDVTGLTSALAGKSDVGHGHVVADVSGLSAALAGKLDVGATAATASKLATARNIQVDLGATGAASFDGTANATPGVTGSLPQASVTNLVSDLAGKLASGATAASASKLATARTVQVDLGATGAASFDGTGNILPGVTGSLPQSFVTNLTSDLAGKQPLSTNLTDFAGKAAPSGAVVGTTDSQTLSGKTLSAPALTGTAAVAQGGEISLFNTVDQVTNRERLAVRWNSNIAEIGPLHLGTGTFRNLRIGVPSSNNDAIARFIEFSTAGPFGNLTSNATGFNSTPLYAVLNGCQLLASSGTQTSFGITPTINQSSTAAYTCLLINPTETATGSGTKRLIDAQVGGTSKFTVDNAGNVGVADNAVVSATSSGSITFNASSANGLLAFSSGSSANGGSAYAFSGPIGGASIANSAVRITPTINQSGTSSYTALLINPSETATGSGTKRLIDAQVGGVSKFTVDNAGNVAASGTVQTTALKDSNGNTIASLAATASAVNYLELRNNSGTGSPAIVSAGSGSSNINLNLSSAGSGSIIFRNSSNSTITFSVAGPTTAVNYLQAVGANAGGKPSLMATGSDTNIPLNLITTGTGTVQANGVDVVTTTGSQSMSNKTLTSPTLTAPVLGTPASGTLTNCTGLPVSGLSATGTPSSSTYLRGDGSWQSLVSRSGTVASTATPAINTDSYDVYGITALAVDITGFTMTGTPVNGQRLWVYVVGTASRAITWGSSFENGPASLPGSTSGTQRLDVGFVWNAATSKWRCVASGSA